MLRPHRGGAAAIVSNRRQALRGCDRAARGARLRTGDALAEPATEVVTPAPQLPPRQTNPDCGSVRSDETFTKIRGQWRYVYWAIDKPGTPPPRSRPHRGRLLRPFTVYALQMEAPDERYSG